jgi:hypothetical protein
VFQSSGFDVMGMELMELLPGMLIFNQKTQLIAKEDVINVSHCESSDHRCTSLNTGKSWLIILLMLYANFIFLCCTV